MNLQKKERHKEMKCLIRFDDICPQLNWEVWNELEPFLIEHGITPILAVIPDNMDETLKVGKVNNSFWEKVKQWQKQGWTIGLHGFQHRYVNTNSGIIGLNAYSEFAGLSYDTQKDKITKALNIFNQNEIEPDIWVAPAHSFDSTTLDILNELDLASISDGYFLYPGKNKDNLFWLPQQVWSLNKIPFFFGIWTVCYHINNWTKEDIHIFKKHIIKYKKNCISYLTIYNFYKNRNVSFIDRLFSFFWKNKITLENNIKKLYKKII